MCAKRLRGLGEPETTSTSTTRFPHRIFSDVMRANPRVTHRGLLWRAALYTFMGTCAVACTRMLGIDGEYTLSVRDGGGAGEASGGATGGGGATSGGGGNGGGTAGSGASFMGGSGGTSGGGGAGGSPPCPNTCVSGTICCGGECIPISPETACGPDCKPCPQPVAHAEAFCDALAFQCSARCSPGYVFEATAEGCVAVQSVDSGNGSVDSGSTGGSSGGGAGGTTGGTDAGVTGGTGGGGQIQCTAPDVCPPCVNPAVGPVTCCDRITQVCGCTWFPIYCL